MVLKHFYISFKILVKNQIKIRSDNFFGTRTKPRCIRRQPLSTTINIVKIIKQLLPTITTL